MYPTCPDGARRLTGCAQTPCKNPRNYLIHRYLPHHNCMRQGSSCAASDRDGNTACPITGEHGPTTATAGSQPGKLENHRYGGFQIMKKLLLLTAAVAMFGATARTANAQASDFGTTSASVPATAQLTIGSILFISIDANAITFPTPTATEFTAGKVDANQVSNLFYFGNVTHDVEILAGAGTFTPSGLATYNKPASDFRYSVDGGTTYVPISTTIADIVTANPPGTGNTSVNYEVLLDEGLDEPGTYTLGFSYTIVPN